MLKSALFAVLLATAASVTAQADVHVDPALLDELHQRNTTTMLVYLREQADLSPAFDMDWQARGRFVYQALTETAERSQAGLRGWLTGRGAGYQSFWVDNVVVVEQGDLALLDGLRGRPEVAAIIADREVYLIEPDEIDTDADISADRGDPVWLPVHNIAHVDTEAVWAMGYEGEGFTLATIDSGARYTHEVLVQQYRGRQQDGSFQHDYHWRNPYSGGAVPVDEHGHGTHVTGTMLGSDFATRQTGVAPRAQWIACAGLPGGSGTTQGLLSCGQFIAAPTRVNGADPDPDRRPHVVNNSWGGCGSSYDNYYEGVIDAWIAAGIVPVFANGNASNCGYAQPPGLNTVGNPARSGKVLSIGSTGADGHPSEPSQVLANGQYAPHSNWGPTDNASPGLPDYPDHFGFPNLKPNVTAPGVWVLSAWVHNDDIGYAWSGGTSMSAPHVAGLVALMWEAAPCLIGDYAATGTLIMQTARPIDYASGGNPPPGPGNVPNHATGWGEIDVFDAVIAALAACNPHGTVHGQVTSAATGAPVAGALVNAPNPGGQPAQFSTLTDADGYYHFPYLPILQQPDGAYDLIFGKDGFASQVIENTEIPDGAALQIDVALDAGLLVLPAVLQAVVVHDTGGTVVVNVNNVGTLDTGVELSLLHGLNENFEHAVPPPAWTLIDNGGDCSWTRNDQLSPATWPVDPNHGGRPNLAGGDGFSAAADADACGEGTQIDSLLISPPLDHAGGMAAVDSLAVNVIAAFKADGLDSHFALDVSGDGGENWDNHLTWTTSVHAFGPGSSIDLDLDDYLGADDIRLRFRYTGSGESWAQIDQLHATLSGGLDWAALQQPSLLVPAQDGVDAVLDIDTGPLPGPGVYPLTLVVEHTAPEQVSPLRVPIEVRVIGPDTPVLNAGPAHLAFGEVETGTSGAPQALTLTSIGTGPVGITAIDDPGAPFARTGGDCPAVPFDLAPGDDCTLEYDFVPQTPGSFEAVIAITTDADPATIEVTLQGTGISTEPPVDDVFRDRFEQQE